jgi:diamine N-acetyltransferase
MIHSNRVRLRAVEPDDLPRFVAWLNDPEVRSGLALYLPLSLREEERWLEEMLRKPADERPLSIDVRDEQAGNSPDAWRHAGSCGLMDIHWRNRSAELGVCLGDKRIWNQGYGTEVVSLLVRHAFGTLNLYRIFLRVHESNPRAVRAYEKAGFIHEGRMRQAEHRDGRYWDLLFMSILRPEWEARVEAAGRAAVG